MKVNRNRGFSLVELIVAFAIFAIAGIAVTGFVSFSSKTFSNSNSQLKLQYEQQVVINNIRDAIVKTTRGISFNDATDTLLVLSESGVADTPVLATQYRLDGATNELKMAEKKFSIDGLEEGVEPNITFAASDEEPLSDSMTGFDVDLTEVNNNRVTLHAAFKVGDKEVEVHPVIALRNNGEELSLQGDGLDDAEYGDYEGFEVDPVTGVVIYWNGKAQPANANVELKMLGNTDSIKTTSMQLTAQIIKNKVYFGAVDEGILWEIDSSCKGKEFDTYIKIDSNGKLEVKPKETKGKYSWQTKYNIPDCLNKEGKIIVIAKSKQDPSKFARIYISLGSGGDYVEKITENNVSGGVLEYKETSNDYIDFDYASNAIIYNTSYTVKYTSNTYKAQEALNRIKLISCKTDKGEEPPTGAGFSPVKFDGRFVITTAMAGKRYNVVLYSTENTADGSVYEYRYVIDCPPIEKFPDNNRNLLMPRLNLLTDGDLKRGQDILFNIDWKYDMMQTRMGNNDVRTYYEIDVNYLNNECGSWERNDRSRFGETVSIICSGETDKSVPKAEKQKVVISQDKVIATKGKETFAVKAEPFLDWNERFTLQVTMRVRFGTKSSYSSTGEYFRPMNGYDFVVWLISKAQTLGLGGGAYTNHTKDANEFVITKQLVFDPVTMTLEEVETNPLPASYEGIVNTSHTIGLGKKTNEPAVEGEKDIITDKPLTNRVLYDYYKVFKPTFTALYVTPDNYADYVHLTLHNSTDSGESPIRPYYYNQGERNWTRNVVGTAIGMVPTEKELYFYGMMSPVKWYKKTATFPIGAKMSMRVGDNKGNAINATFVQDGKRLDYIDYKVKFEYEK